MQINEIERFSGCLVGLATGDALGTTLEFTRPGEFEPITDIVGGGPWKLPPGYWTDDTSMALCLAESLLQKNGFDPVDQMERYVRWYRDGHLSSTGRCFDIGLTTVSSLKKFMDTWEPYCGSDSPEAAGNGSIMRLAPIPLYYFMHEKVLTYAQKSSLTTHGTLACQEACIALAAVIFGALQGAPKKDILGDTFFNGLTFRSEIKEVVEGSFKVKNPPEIEGDGYVLKTLEAALWAFHNSESFEEGALKVVNLGQDADSTGAVYGQIAGAYYGLTGIPPKWREKVYQADLIRQTAEALYLANRDIRIVV